MNTSQTNNGKDNSKQKIEHALEKLEDNFRKAVEEPKFILEIVGFIVLTVYAGYTIAIYYANRDAANAGATASTTASKQLEMMDRPWIKDNVISAFEMGWQQGSYLGWAVNIRTENVGHSVATGIFPAVKLIPVHGADFIDGPRQQMKKLCDEVSERFEKVKDNPSVWVTSVFPGEPIEFPGYNVYLLPSDVTKNAFESGNRKSVMPMLIGCIEYHYPSSVRAHHTGFVYQLSHDEDAALESSSRVFFDVGKPIPKDKITLRKVGQFVD